MSKNNREIIPTSFNMNDEFERGLHEHAKAQGVASQFIKRLIWLHKEGYLDRRGPLPSLHEAPVMDEKKQKALKQINI